MPQFLRFIKKPGFLFLILIAEISMKPGFNLACLRVKEKKLFDSKKTNSRETWCYTCKILDLKEKRPGFMFSNGMQELLDI
jgi:hypothetical protein